MATAEVLADCTPRAFHHCHTSSFNFTALHIPLIARSAVWSQAKSDLDSKKVRLAKLRGTPGLKEDKIAETERDVNEADQRQRNAKLG